MQDAFQELADELLKFLAKPNEPHIAVVLPVNWQYADAIKIDDLLRSDFIGFRHVADAEARAAIAARQIGRAHV